MDLRVQFPDVKLSIESHWAQTKCAQNWSIETLQVFSWCHIVSKNICFQDLAMQLV